MKQSWIKLFNEDISITSLFRVEPTKGKLVYEYNAFRNYRLNEPLYKYNKKTYTQSDLKKEGWNPYYVEVLKDDSSIPTKKEDFDELIGKTIFRIPGPNTPECFFAKLVGDVYKILVPKQDSNFELVKEPGELYDFDTDELQFSLHHPVTMIPLYSYDGSVNLILTDGLNLPRLINSRFSATGKMTYEVIDRAGNNDTNIYDLGEQFDIDSSLYKKVISIPKIEFKGTLAGGNMPVGNYHFYFKLMDADGNETDFVGESGLVSVFIGNGPFSATTGLEDENSYKIVKFKLTNIDVAYSYVSVYYSRASSALYHNANISYKHIDKKFLVTNNGVCIIDITGYEVLEDITKQDINLNFNIIDAAKTGTQCENMLFLGNVHKQTIPYKELLDLSLRFLPYIKENTYDLKIDLFYNISSTDSGYYDEKNIYYKVGYWNDEIYRIGIVYIMKNGELSPVFNIRGKNKITEFDISAIKDANTQYNDNTYTEISVFNENGERVYINYDEETNLIIPEGDNEGKTIEFENIKGVIRIKTNKEHNIIHALDIRTSDEVIKELSKYVKGYFFVRLTRIPTIVALGITMGIDNEAHTPVITVAGDQSFVADIVSDLRKSHTDVDNIYGPLHISEGFLSRYRYNVKAKKSTFFKKVALITAAVAIISVGVMGSIFTGGATGVISGVLAGSLLTAAAGITGGVVVAGLAVAGIGLAAQTISRKSRLPKDLRQDARTEALHGRSFTYDKKTLKRVEIDNSRKLTHDFKERAIIKDKSTATIEGILCPDYELNLHYLNSVFTGNEHVIASTINQPDTTLEILKDYSLGFFNNDRGGDPNYFYALSYKDTEISQHITAKVVGVPDDCPLVTIDDHKFRSRAGWAEEVFRYECIGQDYKSEEDKTPLNSDSQSVSNGESEETQSNKKINTEIIRGSFGPYVAYKDENNTLDPATIVNIYIPNYTEKSMFNYFSIRMSDTTPYEAISDRFEIKAVGEFEIDPNYLIINNQAFEPKGYSWVLYRGDCYICLFTHRLNRNFLDPSTTFNDDFIDINTWKDNYDPNDTSSYANINLSDVNAVKLGMWVTFTVRSNSNLNIRTLDHSNVDEKAMVGHPRGYYPYFYRETSGSFKHPDSLTYNQGFLKSVSERVNMLFPDVPAVKNWYGTRVMYSDIHINDAFKNGFRYFLGTAYKDFTREYGEITKIISYASSLFIVFEHGIGISEINAKAPALNALGGYDYLNVNNVLGELQVLSDKTGSLWQDSILKTPSGIYGVDTVAKLIWGFVGGKLEILSDFKVNEFLNNYITLGERELEPTLGIRNVKTTYNAFKNDVMFTFYDDTYSVQECVWNLCWNENLKQFTTFYSWVPSFMENINNIPFSFNRDTSKWIAKLGTSHTENSFADGITLSLNIIGDYIKDNQEMYPAYIGKDTFNFKLSIGSSEVQNITLNMEDLVYTRTFEDFDEEWSLVGVLNLDNRAINLGKDMAFAIDYELLHDPYLNFKKFRIEKFGELKINSSVDEEHPNKYIYTLYSNSGEIEYVINKGSNKEAFEIISKEIFSFGSPILLPIYALYVKVSEIDSLKSELFYRNHEKTASPSFELTEDNKLVKVGPSYNWKGDYFLKQADPDNLNNILYPPFKNRAGLRLNLPRPGTNLGINEAINPDKIVTMLHIKANIKVRFPNPDLYTLSEAYYASVLSDKKYIKPEDPNWVNAGSYESSVAVLPQWNMLFLSTDFWKHGQAGLIDIADDIYPCYWYGKQHPFEFEVIANDSKDGATHKLFTNLQLIANKAKPESFHYEVIGEVYLFAKDKKNAYYRQEAKRALWQWNGSDICYNNNFLKILPELLLQSFDLPHVYTARQDTINEIEDYYVTINNTASKDYRWLSGGEVSYYPNRQEFRLWNHVKAVALSDFDLDDANSLIQSNIKYVEDKWLVNILPLVITFKNEYYHSNYGLFESSTWDSPNRPPLTVQNSPIPNKAYETILANAGEVEIPPVLKDLGYSAASIDFSNWRDDVLIYQHSFGESLNIQQVPLRDRFLKIRVRYTGNELAVIDGLKTIYTLSYA